MMNRITGLLCLAATLTLSIACGDSGEGTETDVTTTNEPTTEGTSATDPVATTSDMNTGTTAGTMATSSASSTTAEPTGTTGTEPMGGGFCQEECMEDEDCLVMGVDSGFTCVENRCQAESSGCAEDFECVALFSGWVIECESQDECIGQVCVDIGDGTGRCATEPSDVLSCDTLMQLEAEYPPIEGGEPVVVCAQPDAECDEGGCRLPCSDDNDCLSESAPVCNTDTGVCECATDAHCESAPGASVCVEGTCQCAADEDCDDVDNADVCSSGSCGCSSVDACMGAPAFDDTVYVCEG